MAGLTVAALATLLAGHRSLDITIADAALFMGGESDKRTVRWRCACKAEGSETVTIPFERANRELLTEAVGDLWRMHMAGVLVAAYSLTARHPVGGPDRDDWAMRYFGHARQVMAARHHSIIDGPRVDGLTFKWRIDSDLARAMWQAGKLAGDPFGGFTLYNLPVQLVDFNGDTEPDDDPVFEFVIS